MRTLDLNNQMVLSEDGRPMFKCIDATHEEIKQTINSQEAFSAIKEFVDDVNSGKLKPRATVKKFQSLLDKTS